MAVTDGPRYAIEPFSKGQHDRSKFSCGIESLDRYLREQADQDRKRNISVPFVCIEKGQHDILGYYTLSALSISTDGLPPDIIKKLPRYPSIPATLIGRLAVNQAHQGKGIGKLLLIDALQRSLNQAATIASFAIVVDVINEDARNFYLRFEFRPFMDYPNRLFLPMKTIEQLLNP